MAPVKDMKGMTKYGMMEWKDFVFLPTMTCMILWFYMSSQYYLEQKRFFSMSMISIVPAASRHINDIVTNFKGIDEKRKDRF